MHHQQQLRRPRSSGPAATATAATAAAAAAAPTQRPRRVRRPAAAIRCSAAADHAEAVDTVRKVAAVRELAAQKAHTESSRAQKLQQQQSVRRAELEKQLAFQTLHSTLHQQQQPPQQLEAAGRVGRQLQQLQQQQWAQQRQQQQQQQQQQGGGRGSGGGAGQWVERPPRVEPQWQHERKQQQQDAAAAAVAAALAEASQELPAHHLQLYQQQEAPPFAQLAGAIDMLVRSHQLLDWRRAASLLRHSLVPLVASPLQAHQAWRLIARLAARPLKGATARLLGSALVALVRVSLAHNDHNVLQALVAATSPATWLSPDAWAAGGGAAVRFALSAGHVHDLVAAAAGAGADAATLRALLELAPACQLSARAYFAAARAAANRGQWGEVAAVFNRARDAGVRPPPALQRLLAHTQQMQQQQLQQQQAAHDHGLAG